MKRASPARPREEVGRALLPLSLLLLSLLLLPAVSLPGQQNPFMSAPGSEDPQEDPQETPPEDPSETPPEDEAGSGQSTLQRRISSAQKVLYSRLSTAMGGVKSGEERTKMLAIVVSVSFIYGLLHALGPGHRKTVLFSYFVAHKVPLSRGIAAGAGMALLHGAAAIALILPIYLLLRGSILVSFNTASRYIELITFIFIALFGAVMLTHSLWRIIRSEKNKGSLTKPDQTRPDIDTTFNGISHGTGSRDADHHRKDSQKSRDREKPMTALIIGSGLVPCPGAATILLFALSMQMTGVGIMAVAAMSLGMAVTLAGVAFFTLGARTSLQKIGGGSALAGTIHHTLEIGGYMLITIFGLIMTLGYT
ncbi:MAG: nickel/cobalt transporter [Spirochaetaceae bacterium]